VRDDRDAVERALDACAGCDVIVTSGGVSVGAFDYVKAALEARGGLDFWRIAIKPGKPLAFGRIGGALFFGLPGNPVSSLVTFELFVRPVLRTMAGHRNPLRRVVSAVLATPLPHEPGRREFVRARLTWEGEGYLATPTGAQGSHRLSSLTAADAYLIAHEEHEEYAAGERLPAMLLS
jgi:molybdopterin molybdotransferase